MPKGHYPISAEARHERAKKAAAARYTPGVYIRQLARAVLTDEEKRQLAQLLMPFLLTGGAGRGRAGPGPGRHQR